MTPTNAVLTAAALRLVRLDSESRVIAAEDAENALMAAHNVTRARARTSVACAARRLRNAQFAAEGTADFTLRIRLTEPQRQRAQIEADRETGGNLSELFRRRTLG
jgi:hypothetical protein